MSGTRWQALCNRALEGVYPALDAMTDAELRLVRAAPKRKTDTNCWWLVSAWATELSDIANMILKARQHERRKAKRAQGVTE